MRKARLQARSELANAEARLKRDPGHPDLRALVDRLRAEYRTLALEDRIREVVDAAPAISAAQRDRLALLLRSGGGSTA